MYVFGELSDESLAKKIKDELGSQGIDVSVFYDDKTQIYVLTVSDQAQLAKAHDYYRVKVGLPKQMEIEEEWVKIKSLPRGQTTYTILVICVAIFILKFTNLGTPLYDLLFISKPESLFFEEIKNGQIWRLLTPVFLHLSVFHILFNMMWFKDLGYIIEHKLGRIYLLSFILFTGVFSNIAQYFVNGPSFGGMSGVLYAMLGFLWIYNKFDKNFGLNLPRRDITIMLGWLVLCLTGFLGHIANTAHAAGLFAGMVAALLLARSSNIILNIKYFTIALLFLVFTVLVEGYKLDWQYFVTLWWK